MEMKDIIEKVNHYSQLSRTRELTEEERSQIEAQVQEELKAKTPDEVLEYMER